MAFPPAAPLPAPPARPLILTLALPRRLAARLEALRRAHAPPPPCRAPAHLALFRHLPGPCLPDLLDALRAEAARTPPFPVLLAPPAIWQESVVLPARAPVLEDLRARLAGRWLPLLIPADRASFRPHVTIANRLDRAARERILRAVSGSWPRPVKGEATGLLLWRYDDGPWSFLARLPLGR